jgi:hypothetical protein
VKLHTLFLGISGQPFVVSDIGNYKLVLSAILKEVFNKMFSIGSSKSTAV